MAVTVLAAFAHFPSLVPLHLSSGVTRCRFGHREGDQDVFEAQIVVTDESTVELVHGKQERSRQGTDFRFLQGLRGRSRSFFQSIEIVVDKIDIGIHLDPPTIVHSVLWQMEDTSSTLPTEQVEPQVPTSGFKVLNNVPIIVGVVVVIGVIRILATRVAADAHGTLAATARGGFTAFIVVLLLFLLLWNWFRGFFVRKNVTYLRKTGSG